MARSTHSGQQTAERSSSKKTELPLVAAAVAGLFHTVTASTPRAKRLARVYPHSCTAARLLPAGDALSSSLRRQGAGDISSEDTAAAAASTEEGDDVEAATWQHSASSLRSSFGRSCSVDDGEEEALWSDGESELALSLTPTRVQHMARSSFASSASDWDDCPTLCAPRSHDPHQSLNAHDDILSRIATLKALCDQGFLSIDEYERRKCAIVDELTGGPSLTVQRHSDDATLCLPPRMSDSSSCSAMATTQQHPRCMAIGRPSHALPLIVPHAPNFANVRSEHATKHVFDYATRQWSSTHVRVALDETPFSKGSLRVVYHLLDVTGPDCDVTGLLRHERKSYVAKVAIDPEEDPQTYFRDTELQAHCAHYAQLYNSYKPPKRVEFIHAWVLELTERNGALCSVEPYIPGEYRKHNNNFGSVSDDERNTPQAFSHFTYEASNHELLAVDIQGVGDLYTDPQLHTLQGDDFGKGNLGVLGFHKFLSSHRCNSICRYLKLPAVNPKDRHADSGTLPVQELMNRDRVRPTQFDSTHYYEHAPMLQKYITQCRDLERTPRQPRPSSSSATASSRHGLQPSSGIVRFFASLFCCHAAQ